jgi:carboxymethylenebutenolidase
MGETINLTAKDGVTLSAYVARPSGTPKGGVVVIQEIFGVNAHIRAVTDSYAAEGYLAIAPAIFDRSEKNFDVGYGPEEMNRGRAIAMSADRSAMMADIEAAVVFAQQGGKVGVVGYCLGGTLAYAAACQMAGIAAASGYYGSGVPGMKDTAPKAPTIVHFGELDAHIPMEGVRAFETARPDVPVYVYSADHGFNCDHRAAFHAESAALARTRTLAHFARYLAS